MEKVILKVKGIIKREGKYLLLKRWYDDRIPDPFMWEFVDGQVGFGEDPADSAKRLITECLGVEGQIVRPAYTWSTLVGETHIVGVAYICAITDYDNITLPEEIGEYAWVARDEFEDYIENINVLKDLDGKVL